MNKATSCWLNTFGKWPLVSLETRCKRLACGERTTSTPDGAAGFVGNGAKPSRRVTRATPGATKSRWGLALTPFGKTVKKPPNSWLSALVVGNSHSGPHICKKTINWPQDDLWKNILTKREFDG